VSRRPGFDALTPFFRIIAEGLSRLVDGEGFFDTLADDAAFEYVVSIPGYPRRVAGREAVAQLYRGYGQTIVLDGFRPIPAYLSEVMKDRMRSRVGGACQIASTSSSRTARS
jgi:hypothetical protein